MRTPHSNHGVTTLLLDPEGYQTERLVNPTSRGASPLRLTRVSGSSTANAHKRNDRASANRSRRPARLHSFTIRAVPETKPHDIYPTLTSESRPSFVYVVHSASFRTLTEGGIFPDSILMVRSE
jgi:hypothetical protein